MEKQKLRKIVKGKVIFEQYVNVELLKDLAVLFRNSNYDTYRDVNEKGEFVRYYSNSEMLYELVLVEDSDWDIGIKR